ncbi:MAG: glycosyltransferase family 9 protein [Proteobacteria bacterium]|nr:glycosyltransferase family 9 protein [Pseudomonadota bacterium]
MSANTTMPPSRILVVATRRIGDVLLTTPLIASIRAAWPDAVLDVLVFAGTGGVLAGLPGIDAVIEVRERPRPLEHARLLRRIALGYDLALSTIPGDRPTLYARLAGRRAIGVQLDGGKHLWKRRLLSASVPHDDTGTHTVLQNLRLADALGIARLHAVQVPPGAELAPALDAELARAPFVVVHPWPRFRYKMWHDSGFVDFGHWAHAHSLRIVLSGGSAADEQAHVRALQGRMPPGTLDLAGELSLAQLAGVLRRAALYLGPDTVVTHMAAAVGVPTVALFGPSNPVKWGPWPAGCQLDTSPWPRTGSGRVGNVYLLQGTAPCAPGVPCLMEGCDRHVGSDSACLTGLPAARVIDAATELLEWRRKGKNESE